MPQYVYRCERGHEVEVWQSINDEPIESCEHDWGRPIESGVYPSGRCGAPCARVIQPGYFKITGAGVHRPGWN